MKNQVVFVCLLMAMSVAGLSQTNRPAEATDRAAIEGVWRADLNGLPYIALTITNETGSLSGAVLFYFHHRDAVGQPWTSTPGIPEPLFNLRFDGQILTFQVSHRRAHPPRTLRDAPVSFRLKLTGANKGELISESEASSRMEIVRADY
jgi:hypothetical protein